MKLQTAYPKADLQEEKIYTAAEGVMEQALKRLDSKYRGTTLRPALFWKVWLSHRYGSSPPPPVLRGGRG